MLTAHDVQTVIFDKAMRGYATDKVDAYLDEVAAQLEADAKKIAELTHAKDQLASTAKEKDEKLAGYVQYEDALKSALLNAQRMGENVIREAQQKAEGIVREATIRAEDINHAAESKTREQEIELERIRSEVAQFKNNVLNLYRTHIESLSTLPDEEPAETAQPEVQPAVLPEPAAEAPAVQPEPVAEPQTLMPQETAPEMPEQPAPAQQNSFWEQDEHSLVENAPAAPDLFDAKPDPIEQPETELDAPESAEPFRGISFSD